MATGLGATTVQFDDLTFLAFATEFSVFAIGTNDFGIPALGSTAYATQVSVDMHDNLNIPFSTVQKLFDHAHSLTRDKIKTCKLTFWKDDQRRDALSTFTFDGWISHFSILSGSESNHLLVIKIQPQPGTKQFTEIAHGN